LLYRQTNKQFQKGHKKAYNSNRKQSCNNINQLTACLVSELYKTLLQPTTTADPAIAAPAGTINSLFTFNADDDLPLERLRFDAQR
jgi:hypothetical protein